MARTKEPRWRTWPHREFAREAEDLYLFGARCDAWRKFMTSDTLARLRRIKGHAIWFNRYEYFDDLIIEFDCTERALRRAIQSLLLPTYAKQSYEFLRKDIYDVRAWAEMPLNWFVRDLDAFNQRTLDRQRWQHEVLAANEMPIIKFGIKSEWSVSRDCFTLTHRLRHDERFAEMTFNHPHLDSRFKGKRWVADGVFPREATRSEMAVALFAEVEAKCAQYKVSIIEADV